MTNRQDRSNNNNENVNYKDKKQNDKDFVDINTNAAKSFNDIWQRYSPTAWNEMYNEYSIYTTRMIELYQEYAKSSEKMTRAVQGNGHECR